MSKDEFYEILYKMMQNHIKDNNVHIHNNTQQNQVANSNTQDILWDQQNIDALKIKELLDQYQNQKQEKKGSYLIDNNEKNDLSNPIIFYSNNYYLPQLDYEKFHQNIHHNFFFTCVITILIIVILILLYLVYKMYRITLNNNQNSQQDNSQKNQQIFSQKILNYDNNVEEQSTKSKSNESQISKLNRFQSLNGSQKSFKIRKNSIPYVQIDNTLDQDKIVQSQGNHLQKRPSIKKSNSYQVNQETMEILQQRFHQKFIEKQNSVKNSNSLKDINKIHYENGRFNNCFIYTNIIGNGSFGQVFKAIHKLDSSVYAIKRIRFDAPENFDLRKMDIIKEIQAMVKLNHENIVKFITCWIEQVNEFSDESVEDTNKNKLIESINETDFSIHFGDTKQTIQKQEEFYYFDLYIQMEYCDGKSLDQCFMKKDLQITDNESFLIFQQLLQGMKYIHKEGFIHRDLKPQNIFINRGATKIGDFGLATINIEKQVNSQNKDFFIKKKKNGELQYSCNVGTPLYQAPEQQSQNQYDEKVDIYAMGIILYELLSKFKTKHEKIKKIQKLRETNQVEENFYKNYPIQSKIINRMIKQDAQKRPIVNQILNSQELKDWHDQMDHSRIKNSNQFIHCLNFAYIILNKNLNS